MIALRSMPLRFIRSCRPGGRPTTVGNLPALVQTSAPGQTSGVEDRQLSVADHGGGHPRRGQDPPECDLPLAVLLIEGISALVGTAVAPRELT